eukprot:m.236036 g.236036  ORF g.236036 m.236036 type:complete len:104 (-) comp19347_c0_seq17:3202-3513(-)
MLFSIAKILHLCCAALKFLKSLLLRVVRVQAADLGHTQAAFNTATFYHRGQFVGKNLSTALRFYHAAADDGHEGAMNNAMLLQQEIGNEGTDFRLVQIKSQSN